MQAHRFILWLEQDPRDYDAWTDALFEAGGDDCSPGEHSGRPYASFHREAQSLEEAIRSARETVQAAGLQVVMCEIPEEAMAAVWSSDQQV